MWPLAFDLQTLEKKEQQESSEEEGEEQKEDEAEAEEEYDEEEFEEVRKVMWPKLLPARALACYLQLRVGHIESGRNRIQSGCKCSPDWTPSSQSEAFIHLWHQPIKFKFISEK